MKKLNKKEKDIAIKKLSGWSSVKGRNAISKQFQFKNFSSAFNWMTAIAFYAEKKIIILNGSMFTVMSMLHSLHMMQGV